MCGGCAAKHVGNDPRGVVEPESASPPPKPAVVTGGRPLEPKGVPGAAKYSLASYMRGFMTRIMADPFCWHEADSATVPLTQEQKAKRRAPQKGPQGQTPAPPQMPQPPGLLLQPARGEIHHL